ncbi:hypothetical protein G7Y79_00029g064070 [Physcia stellaris]|nr:hypothetical protein G7Y79_00029g064070 [Physcia stellaris]
MKSSNIMYNAIKVIYDASFHILKRYLDTMEEYDWRPEQAIPPSILLNSTQLPESLHMYEMIDVPRIDFKRNQPSPETIKPLSTSVDAGILMHLPADSYRYICPVSYGQDSTFLTKASTNSALLGTLPKHPPLVPYLVPFLGNLFAFLKNPAQLSSSVLREFPVSTPMRLKLEPIKMYIVSGSDNIVTLFKSSRSMSTKPGMIIALRNIFGTSAKTIPFYASDDTGMCTKPYPGSTCRVEHRIIYYQQRAAHQHLTGPGLLSMAERYMKILAQQFSDLNLGEDWTDFADLYEFLQIQVAKASIEAMCGKHILRLNPTFIEDLWAFDRSVGTLLKGLPRWLCPRQYSARDKILSGIKKWHAFAHMHSDCNRTASNDPDWEPYFGHKLVRERQKYSMKMDVMDADARASEDLGLIFAANTNAVPAAFWFVFEAFKDRRLLSELRQELETSQKSYEREPRDS